MDVRTLTVKILGIAKNFDLQHLICLHIIDFFGNFNHISQIFHSNAHLTRLRSFFLVTKYLLLPKFSAYNLRKFSNGKNSDRGRFYKFSHVCPVSLLVPLGGI